MTAIVYIVMAWVALSFALGLVIGAAMGRKPPKPKG